MRYVTIALLLVPVLAAAGEWYIEAVDTSGTENVGGYNSLALDSSCYPHIAYIDSTNVDLKYARWDGAAWRIETVDSEGSVGGMNSLALDSSDYAHIAYNDYTNFDLKYARWDGAEWRIETVDADGDVGYYISLALDDSGYPHISYAADYRDDLKYARWDGAEWRIEIVDSAGQVGGYSSLTLDSSNYPHISYHDSTNNDLKYARWDGAAWRIEAVDETGDAGVWTSLALDSNDYPHISCSGGDDSDLIYARWDGDAWQIETVDSDDWVGLYTSLAIDSNDYPHISYGYFLVYTDYDLKYARWDGSSWHIETVDSEGDVGSWTSLALDTSDNPHISYYDGGNGNLKYAWYYPYSFYLVSPEKGEIVTTTTPTLDWTDDDNPDLASYTLRWGTDPDFVTYNEVTDIGESEYTITGGIQDEDLIYWRVKSVNSEGGEHWAEEMDWHFTVYINFNPIYHLLSPEMGEVVDAFPLTFDWQDQQIPGLESYTLWWGTDPDFDTYNEVTDIDESEYTLSGGIEDGDRIYWRVKSIDDQSEEYWAVEMDWYFDVDLGGGVDIVDFAANAEDEGILVNWRIEGDSPSGLRVLRTIDDEEPIFLHSEPLNGDATKYLDRDVSTGVEYRYWLEVTEADGTVKRFGPTESVSIPEQISRLALGEPYPSPAREAVTIRYELPNGCSDAVIEVYDLSGRRLDSIPLTDSGEITLEVSEYASGVYTARLSTDKGSVSRRLVITR